MDLITRIEQKMHVNGIAFFGTAYIRECLPKEFSHLPYSITIGMRYPKTVIRQIDKAPTKEYFHQYRTMNANLDRCGILAQSMLLNEGFEAVYIPASQSDPKNEFSGALSHKIGAVKSGLGFVGKSNLFIHKDYGPAVRLLTVLTDMKLPEGKKTKADCGDCDKCFKACPAGAIHNVMPSDDYNRDDVLSPEKCSYFMKTKFQHIGRGSVCGICIRACPYSV